MIPQYLPHSEVGPSPSAPERHILYSHNRTFFIGKTAPSHQSPVMQTPRVQRCQKTPRSEHLQWNLRESKEFREIESRDKKQAVAELDHEDKQSLLDFR